MPDHMSPVYLNPGLYQPYTFTEFPPLTYESTVLIGSYAYPYETTVSERDSRQLSSEYYNDNWYVTTQYYSTIVYFSTQLSTTDISYASYQMLYPVTFYQRFGTELQTISNVYYSETEILGTYEYTYSTSYIYYHDVVKTYDIFGQFRGASAAPINSYLLSYGLDDYSTLNTVTTTAQLSKADVGSSMFVEMLGSNVYTGLLITTNSVIVYENEQISSYYSESLSYEINVANLTAALNSVAGGSPDNSGWGTITVTTFAWTWFTTTQGWSGSQLTNFSSYLFSTVVNSYLYYTYDGTVISGTSQAATEVQSLITIENNNLSNAQTFLNDAVSQLQSSISLASQIIGSLASCVQTILSYF